MSDLAPNDYNPNEMSPGQFAALKATMRKDGFLGVILANKTARGLIIVDGEQRWRAARELGLHEVPCLVIEMPEEHAKAMTVKLNQIHGTWNAEELLSLLRDLPDPLDELGFSQYEFRKELEALLHGQAAGELIKEIETQMARAPDPLASVRFVGFTLAPEQENLLGEALRMAECELENGRKDRAGALMVIVRAYLRGYDQRSQRTAGWGKR
jgi:hypothetical protein